MKSLSIFFIAVCSCALSLAQNNVNLVIFNEEPEPFFVYVNGVKQNATPETNVRLAGITPNISLRIEFVNKAYTAIKQTMALEPGFEHTGRIRKDKNMQMKLKYFGQVPLDQASTASVPTVTYHTAEEPFPQHDGYPNSAGGSTTSVQSITTTSTYNNNSMAVEAPGIGITMNIDPRAAQGMQTTTSTTVTTTTSGSNAGVDRNAYEARNPRRETHGDGTHGHHNHDRGNDHRPEANATVSGCRAPMTASNFSKMKESVSSKSFSDTKMSTAKLATKSSCLSVSQIKEIAALFSMDDDRRMYAEFAYDYCTDKANYYQVADVFKFSSTTDDFNKFLESK